MAIVVVVDALDTDLRGAGFAKVLNHLVRMFRAWNALKVSEQKRHSFLRVNEVYDLLIFPAVICAPLHYRLIIIWAFGQPLSLNHISDTRPAERAAALMKYGWHTLLEVERVSAVVAEKQVVHFLFVFVLF